MESGLSIAVGGKYKKEYLKSDKYFSFNIAQNYRYKKNDDLPINGSIGKKSSDIFANIEYNLNDSFNLKYDFNMKENLKKSNYDLISTKFSFDNFVTTFEYLDEKNSINKNSFISNKTSLLIDENNTLSFGTRKNRKINLTEYYDLIYQYTNDCLEAGIAYKKEYYNDSDLKSERTNLFHTNSYAIWQNKISKVKIMYRVLKLIFSVISLYIMAFNLSIKAENNVKIIYNIGDTMITNIDIKNQYRFLLLIDKNFSKLDEKQGLEIAKQESINDKIKTNELKKTFDLDKNYDLIDDIINQHFKKNNINSNKEIKKHLKDYNLEYEYLQKKISNRSALEGINCFKVFKKNKYR